MSGFFLATKGQRKQFQIWIKILIKQNPHYGNWLIFLVIFYQCWFELVRLFRNCGTINKLEYLFHKIGPQAGQPRGYAFLTFAKRDDAIKARREFDGKTLLGRTLLVKPARSVSHVRNTKTFSFSKLRFWNQNACFFRMILWARKVHN